MKRRNSMGKIQMKTAELFEENHTLAWQYLIAKENPWELIPIIKDVILEIELQGARQVCAKRPDVIRIFIAPPSWSALEQRLIGRGTDSSDKIHKRLVRAKVELQNRIMEEEK